MVDKEIDIKELEKRFDAIKKADKDRPRKEFQDATQKKEEELESNPNDKTPNVHSERESDTDFQDIKKNDKK
ncbi:hypothetical protein [Autumnicola edwardsiae]|uniref:Uncharacterized protein n=1 Tax=Autumnicola edwardsiae TaxID=3075594 RepID=A0ABU3CUW7_9FLAO|nr:hypothetical protein [Zunongwangia sp. F297]MDT0650139.1 hypothetical protein [Zunongwangia sp. F297]